MALSAGRPEDDVDDSSEKLHYQSN